MRRLTLARAMLCFGLLGAGCSDPTGVESDILSARIVRSELELRNDTQTPVYYFAADRGILALLDWAVCIQPSECNGVSPHSTTSIALDDIIGGGESAEIVVYHWRLVQGQSSTGYVADSIRSLIVPVR
jgi:hypothetical protein